MEYKKWWEAATGKVIADSDYPRMASQLATEVFGDPPSLASITHEVTEIYRTTTIQQERSDLLSFHSPFLEDIDFVHRILASANRPTNVPVKKFFTGPSLDDEVSIFDQARNHGSIDLSVAYSRLGQCLGMVTKEFSGDHRESMQLTFFVNESSPEGKDPIRRYDHKSFPYQRLLFDVKCRHACYWNVLAERDKIYESVVNTPSNSSTFHIIEKHSHLPQPIVLKSLQSFVDNSAYSNQVQAMFADFVSARGEGPNTSAAAVGAFPMAQHFPPEDLCTILRRAGCLFENRAAVFRKMLDILTQFVTKLLDRTKAILVGSNAGVNGAYLLGTDVVLRVLRSLRTSDRYARSFEVYGYGVSCCPRYLMANGILSTLQNLHPALVLEEVSLSVLHDMLTTTLMDILKMAASLKVSTQALQNYHAVYLDFSHALILASPVTIYEPAIPDTSSASDTANTTVTREDDVITHQDVQQALKVLFTANIGKFALQEGSKAVQVYTANANKADLFAGQGGAFRPETIALIAFLSAETRGLKLSASAIVFLSAVCGYVCSEVLELSGNATRDYNHLEILPRHIQLAVSNDEELGRILPGVIRYGGEIPNIHSRLVVGLPRLDRHEGYSQWRKAVCEGLEKGGVGVDVSNGKYFAVLGEGEDDAHSQLMSTLNVLSPSTGMQRILRYWQSLPEDQQALLFEASQHPLERFRDHVSKIRLEQSSTTPALNFQSFYLFLQSISRRAIGVPVDFSMEAVDLLQTVSEAYLVKLSAEAVLATIHTKSVILQPESFDLVRRVRGEL